VTRVKNVKTFLHLSEERQVDKKTLRIWFQLFSRTSESCTDMNRQKRLR